MSADKKRFLGKNVWVTGSTGMVGSALLRRLKQEDCVVLSPSRKELDLCDAAAVLSWAQENKPQFVFHAAAMVGGIFANATLPAEFLFNNLAIAANVINASKIAAVEKLIFVASNCIYPSNSPQPISERLILTGPLEENVRYYGISKIAGIELCRAYRKQFNCDFVSVVPPNLYGPGDNYHESHAHVVAGILRRSHEAKLARSKEVTVWGDGTARRELLYVDDLADAMVFLMGTETNHDVFNVGCGHDFKIAELARLILEVVGFNGRIAYDTAKPNGTMQKLLDSSRLLALGWRPKIDERTGLQNAYFDYLNQINAQVAR